MLCSVQSFQRLSPLTQQTMVRQPLCSGAALCISGLFLAQLAMLLSIDAACARPGHVSSIEGEAVTGGHDLPPACSCGLLHRAAPSCPDPQTDPALQSHAAVDFCISLGGDGTVLHLTSLFVEDTPLPPVMSFSMGTLGFLTPFDVGEFVPCLQRVLRANEDPVFCTLRTRKRCEVYW